MIANRQVLYLWANVLSKLMGLQVHDPLLHSIPQASSNKMNVDPTLLPLHLSEVSYHSGQ
jgi:hypothetical protein